MLFSRKVLIVASALMSQNWMIAVSDAAPHKTSKGVSNLKCTLTDHVDKLHIDFRQFVLGEDESVSLAPRSSSSSSHVLDPSEFEPESFLAADSLIGRSVPDKYQSSLYLGVTGGSDAFGNEKIGRVEEGNALSFQFLHCAESLLENHDYDAPGRHILYGHLVDQTRPYLCLGPSELAQRNSPLVLRECPTVDDSEQFFVFWKLIDHDVAADVGTREVRMLHFVGEPIGRENTPDFPGAYTVQYKAKAGSMSVDYRKPGEAAAKGKEVLLSFNDRLKAR